eukprot:TRINITY_DN4130_c0_g1_i1.p1 TRINITY_DN4130_c0_g1~~TRINITY_DN4130_c0_g1_i1.p1  ORF type:complete len:403 (-),score=49.31 TRINITY_DN4130_c0_g1_i1:154-1362(-)
MPLINNTFYSIGSMSRVSLWDGFRTRGKNAMFNGLNKIKSTWSGEKAEVAPSIIMGRFQNPWKECHVQRIEQDKVNLVRRKSGGGAVYQDLGNSIYTFISSKNGFSKDVNNKILINALAKIGVNAVASGRNDLHVNGKKVSGAAFSNTAARSLHHGTMLLNVNMNAMPKYLNPNKAKLASKGVSSVTARVMNLIELVPTITHDQFGQALVDSFLEHYQYDGKPVVLPPSLSSHPSSLTQQSLPQQQSLLLSTSEEIFSAVQHPRNSLASSSADLNCYLLDHRLLKAIPQLNSYYEFLKDWNWRFGQTPQFTHNIETRFDWGIMDVYMEVLNGRISNVRIFSDCLVPTMIELLHANLKDVPYSFSGVTQAIKRSQTQTPSDHPSRDAIITYLDDFSKWIVTKL